MRLLRATGACLFLFFTTTVGAAQTPARVRLIEVVQLGTTNAAAARSFSFHAVQLRSGRIVVSPLHTRAQLALYDSAGTLVTLYDRQARVAGDAGASLSPVTVRGDTILTFDRTRLLAFGPDLGLLREMRLDVAPRSAVVTREGQLAINYPFVRGGGQTYAIHLIDPGGAIALSADTVVAGPNAPWAGTRVFAASAKGGFWAARPNSSRIEHFGASGELRQTLNVDRPWFVPWSGILSGEGFRQRPRPRVASIHELPDGTLGVVNHVADASWQRQERDPPVDGTLDFSTVFDSIIEIVDPATGRIVAIGRVPDVVAFVPGSANLLVSAREVAPGEIRIIVWRLRVE